MDCWISCGAASTLLDSNVVGGSPSASLGGNDAHSVGFWDVDGSSMVAEDWMDDIASAPGTRQSSDRGELVESLSL
jgi:hypothetical protein